MCIYRLFLNIIKKLQSISTLLPTPVSSLLHAACLVIAGVYLLIRCSYIVEYSPIVLLLILVLGGISTLISGLIAIVSNDIKKIIALSTMSQVGIMMLAIGISSYNLALFHLICHSFFKALLFMSAGSLIHSIINEYQDIRMFGGFHKFVPLTYTAIFIASLSLMAIPGLTGFYSKDIIIESLYGNYTFTGYIIYWFALGSATLTSLYSVRLVYYIFINTPNSPKYIYMNLHENSFFMYIPMIILTILSIFVGYITKDLYLGLGSEIYNDIFIHPNNLIIIDTEFSLGTFFKVLPLMTSIIFSSILLIIYEFYYTFFIDYTKPWFYNIYSLLNQKIYFDQILNNIIFRSSLYNASLLNRYIDKGFLIFLGPNGLYTLSLTLSNTFNKLVFFNLGLILELIFLTLLITVFFNYYYLFLIFIGLIIFMFI